MAARTEPRVFNNVLTEVEYEQSKKLREPNKKKWQANTSGNSEPHPYAYHNRFIRYISNSKNGFNHDKAAPLQALVESDIKRIFFGKGPDTFTYYASNDSPVGVGSFFERVKVRAPNEFDFMIVMDSRKLPNITYHYQDPPLLKYRTDKDAKPLSYFQIEIDIKSEEWSNTIWSRCVKVEGNRTLLNPHDVQTKFKEFVIKSIEENCGKKAHVTTNGPAITVHLKMTPEEAKRYAYKPELQTITDGNGDTKFFAIDIDLTLAFPGKKGDAESWDVKLSGNQKEKDYFSSDVTSMHDKYVMPLNFQHCHFVAYGNYWRATMSHVEGETMRSLSGEEFKSDTLKAVKLLRDELSITGGDESGILSSYPLKVNYMRVATDKNTPLQWDFWDMSTKADEILAGVEEQGMNKQLKSLWIKDDAILMDSDRSFIECRRMRQHLDTMKMQYSFWGRIHTAIMLVILLLNIGILSVGYYFLWVQIENPSDGTDTKMFNLQAKSILDIIYNSTRMETGILIMAFILLICSIVGIVCVALPKRFTNHFGVRILYSMFKCVTVLYSLMIIISATVVVMAMFLTMGYYELEGFLYHTPTTKALALTTSVLCSLFPLFVMVHLIFFFARTRCQCRAYPYEWVFFDELYSSVSCNTKLMEKAPSSVRYRSEVQPVEPQGNDRAEADIPHKVNAPHASQEPK